jgi:hypothetical protein
MKLKLRKPIALAVSGDQLPTEFRLFVSGWNETENGRYLFDAQAATAVMSAYRNWGIDVAIDLEHQMLDVDPGASDPTARDARGWCGLELRNGELWATNARWTPDGAQRLREKRQRYVSPAFDADPKTKRIVQIMNIAITALPATHHTPALVAASRTRTGPMIKKLRSMVALAISMGGDAYLAKAAVKLSADAGLDPAVVKQALEAIEKGDSAAALDILKGLIASAAGADPDPGEGDGGQGDGAEGVTQPDEATEMGVEDPKVVASSAEPIDPDDEDDDDPKKKKERKAMRRLLFRETGTSTMAECLNAVKDFKASHLTLETERQKLAKDRAVLESAERRKLCVELITLGAEFPGTVWADPTVAKPSKLKSRWEGMPIAELRSHVGEQRSARGAKRSMSATALRAPTGVAAPDGVDLTDDEQKEIAKLSAVDRMAVEKFDAMDWSILRTTPNATLLSYARMKSLRDGALTNGKRA